MKMQRTIPPAVAPLDWRDLFYGLAVISSGQRTLRRFESEIREYFGVRNAFLVSSGKAALTLTLQGLKGISSRNEVIIPAYTCYSVPSSVLKSGLKLSLCDLDPTTFDFEYPSLERMVNDNTLCVIPCHLFGIPADMDRVQAICRERGAYVVEDAAQAMGGTYKGRKLGTIGDVGVYSLGRGKNITCGSGGIIVTNSDPIANAIQQHYIKLESPSLPQSFEEWFRLALMAVFIQPALYWIPAGLPFLKLGETFFHQDFPIRKLSGMQGALLRHWKILLEQSNRKRAENGSDFRERLGLKTPSGKDEPISYLRLPVLVSSREERNRIYLQAREQGLGISIMYPKPVHLIQEIQSVFSVQSFTASTEIAERLLTIPTHQYLSQADREAIVELFIGAGKTVTISDHESGLRFRCQ